MNFILMAAMMGLMILVFHGREHKKDSHSPPSKPVSTLPTEKTDPKSPNPQSTDTGKPRPVDESKNETSSGREAVTVR
jgi:hypothetical protein